MRSDVHCVPCHGHGILHKLYSGIVAIYMRPSSKEMKEAPPAHIGHVVIEIRYGISSIWGGGGRGASMVGNNIASYLSFVHQSETYSTRYIQQ